MSTPLPTATRHLVLLGAGATHRRLVRLLARRPLPAGLAATWLVPADSVLPLERLPGCIAGARQWTGAAIALAPLADAAGVRLMVRRAQALDAATRSVLLDGEERLVWDLLSLDADPVQDRAAAEAHMPGAREHALFVCPPGALAALWPRVLALPPERRGRMAVLGADALAVELACALRAAQPDAAVSLVIGDGTLLRGVPDAVRARVAQALRAGRIDVLPQTARAIQPGRIRLGEGTTLACDLPLVVLGRSALRWPGAAPDRDPDANDAPGSGDGAARGPDTRVSVHGDPGLPVFQLPTSAGPALAARLRQQLERIARSQAMRPLDSSRMAAHTLWLGPGRALAYGERWQFGGPLARWLDHQLHGR